LTCCLIQWILNSQTNFKPCCMSNRLSCCLKHLSLTNLISIKIISSLQPGNLPFLLAKVSREAITWDSWALQIILWTIQLANRQTLRFLQGCLLWRWIKMLNKARFSKSNMPPEKYQIIFKFQIIQEVNQKITLNQIERIS